MKIAIVLACLLVAVAAKPQFLGNSGFGQRQFGGSFGGGRFQDFDRPDFDSGFQDFDRFDGGDFDRFGGGFGGGRFGNQFGRQSGFF
ncbi:keratin, type II cytoskeletal 1-like [Amphibalanus amphitrite]|uniref:keratin, type II cytoskeletal 1-like n=1 Tax=Amphibalanus amphitrite TaxID=1232801 RepID=UPI001C919512|nr:keratin, type II cytoskeletal 1-like [Amphibalanus amphitrite]